MKLEYFKKNGHRTDEEQAVILQIERLIREKQIPRSEIPQCLNKDDLLKAQALLEAYVPDIHTVQESSQNSESDTPAYEAPEIQIEQETESQTEPMKTAPETLPQDETAAEEVQPLAEEVPEFIAQQAEPTPTAEAPKASDQPKFVANDYDPFGDEIKQRSYNMQGEKTGAEKNAAENKTGEPDLSESEDTPLDNLNPKTKRRVAEQTAETLLKGYSRLAPKPFKWLAKIDEEKIERMHFEGEIDINLEVSEGTTFDDYVKQTNEKVEELFEVDEDTLNEIREPLIEVLMEQKLELTPQQRLAMAVVSHLVQMFSIAISLRKQNNRILEFQKRMTMMAAAQRKAAA